MCKTSKQNETAEVTFRKFQDSLRQADGLAFFFLFVGFESIGQCPVMAADAQTRAPSGGSVLTPDRVINYMPLDSFLFVYCKFLFVI